MRPRRPTAESLARIPAAVLAGIGIGRLWSAGTVVSILIVLAVVAFTVFWPNREDEHLDVCAKCAHGRLHHHGPCQACLRAKVAGTSDRVPCSKFRLG